VVPDNFELFCLGFILVEDCIATLNIPLHTGGKRPIKKLDQSQQKPTKTVLKNGQLKTKKLT
jgi:hypothetical protein